MNAGEFTTSLEDVLEDLDPERDVLAPLVRRVTSWGSTNAVLANNDGLTVRMVDGSEFQITVVKSKRES